MYTKLEKQIVEIFNKNNFLQLYYQNKKAFIKLKTGLEVNNDLDIKIVFPGYKTKVSGDKVEKYDYRVDYNDIPVSHVNIVIDFYNKVVQAPHLKSKLEEFIIDLAIKGSNINRDIYLELERFRFLPPNVELLQKVKLLHNKIGKKYLFEGNYNKNYSIDELSKLITLIVMQEDINYPMPRYEGRRMSFYRYLEAIHCVDINKKIDEVILRALSHTRPKLWNEIDYSKIRNIVNLKEYSITKNDKFILK
ncbi:MULTISPECIES: hypothetical protein [Clostridium]|uniref:hypothetical protein n=1 Tax=Clostridium TaxID=1485 RepID=UPI0003FDBA73|nr:MULTISPECIES: hypothetical protein [Clostridium]MDU1311476.1 hypothetical protein [Clostridium sp.]MDU1409005.1 hypothetical protein [Clostridium sp.]